MFTNKVKHSIVWSEKGKYRVTLIKSLIIVEVEIVGRAIEDLKEIGLTDQKVNDDTLLYSFAKKTCTVFVAKK